MGENRLMADLYEEHQRLKARISELEEKHWNECGQIAHYDDERKKIREYLQHSAKTMTVHGVLEALALIGEDTNVPASADDTNVGGKIDSWISVKDRLPDEDGWYLVCKHNRVRVAEWCKDCWYNESDLPIDDCAITYWQSLPEPPKDGDTNG